MADLKLDPVTGDLAIVNGDLALTNDATGETVLQRVTIRLRLFKGEWFLDTRLGIDYMREVFVKRPNLDRIAAILKGTIQETPGVADLTAYSQTFDRPNRKLSVTWRAVTVDGLPIGTTQEIAL